MAIRPLLALTQSRLSLGTLLLIALATRVAAAGPDIPRTADGKPDLGGIWQSFGEANHSLEARSAVHAPMLRDGPYGPLAAAEVQRLGAVIAVPPSPGYVRGGGPIPYTADARAKRVELQRNWITSDPEVKCYLPGVPRATYMPFPLQIFQNAGGIVIAYQFAGAVREIYTSDPGEAPVDAWMGWSHGRWEGDELVVEVTGLHDGTWLDRTGTHHTSAMKVTERYRLLGRDHLQYSATIEDPGVFTAPWTIDVPLYRRVEPGFAMHEFKCVEFVEELLYGEFRRQPLPR